MGSVDIENPGQPLQLGLAGVSFWGMFITFLNEERAFATRIQWTSYHLWKQNTYMPIWQDFYQISIALDVTYNRPLNNS